MLTAPDAPVSFALVRVDDRLLHGQVALNWVRLLNPVRVAIVDDVAAGDELVGVLGRLALPRSVALEVLGLQHARAALLGSTDYPPARTLVLLRSPASALALYDAGVPYAALNLGCLGSAPGRTRVARQLSLSLPELSMLRSLSARGVRVTVRALPGDRPLELEAIACRVLHAPSV